MNSLYVSLLISTFGIFNLLGINSNLAIRQFLYTLGGLFVFFLVKKFRRVVFYGVEYLFYIALFLNIYLVFFGETIKGAKRWIRIFSFSFQPSEVLLIFFVIFLAKLFSDKYVKINDFWIFLKSLVLFFITFLAVYKQPDLGTALNFAFVYFVILAFSRIQKKYLFYLILVSLVVLPLAWFSLKPYQKQRVMVFIKPSIDLQGISYNMRQAEISIGSGRIIGKGLGRGTQVKLFFLPERHTDFAFASFVEQTGFVGGAMLLALYFYLLFYFIKPVFWGKLTLSGYLFDELLSVGFVSYVFYRVFVNIGMNLGVLPVAGVPLPLVSYGGSAILSYFIGLGMLKEAD